MTMNTDSDNKRNAPGSAFSERDDDADNEKPGETWAEFTQEATMHGIRYVHLKTASPFVK